MTENIHATCIDVNGVGVLLMGPPGAGKTDLALRLIDEGHARLVADDRVDVHLRDGALIAAAPATIRGKMEVRGVGIIAVDALAETAVRLVVVLVDRDQVARMPEPDHATLLGQTVPRVHFHAFDASTPIKVRLAAGQAGRILGAS